MHAPPSSFHALIACFEGVKEKRVDEGEVLTEDRGSNIGRPLD
jgi:hypothetical protein